MLRQKTGVDTIAAEREAIITADFGLVDAATDAIAERVDVRRIYTLDRSQFSLLRLLYAALEVLP